MFKKLILSTALVIASNNVIAKTDVPNQPSCDVGTAKHIAMRVSTVINTYVELACRDEAKNGVVRQAQCYQIVAGDYIGFMNDILEIPYKVGLDYANQATKASKEEVKGSDLFWYYSGFGRVFEDSINAKGCNMAIDAINRVVKINE